MEQDQQLFKEGAPADAMFIVLAGNVHLLFNVGGQLLTIGAYTPGIVLGVLPYSRMTHYSGVGVAMEPSRILRIGKDHLNQVWTNLIDNTVDAMDEGGTLTLG